MNALRRAISQLHDFPLLEALCMPVIVFLLSACQLSGLYAPWGLAAVAGCEKKKCFFCAVGAIAGAFGFFAFQPGIRYGAAAILIYCGRLAFSGTGLEKKPWFHPVLAAGMLLIVQSVYLIGRPLSVTLTCLAAVLCTAVCTALWGCIVLPEKSLSPAGGSLIPQESAAAFHALYDSFFRGTELPRPENPSILFDRAAEQVCRDCTLCATCWQAEYSTTYNAFNDACPALLKRGHALEEDFPAHFSGRCIHFPQLLQAVNGELRLFLLRGQYQQRLQGELTMAQQQYARMGDLLASAQRAIPVNTQELLCYRTGTALRPKEGQAVCGDQLAVFRAGGMLYLLLSDGMGSGDAAHAEASMTVRLLQQFLTAGIDPLPALRTLNSALRLRGEVGGGYTTIDLLQLSLRDNRAAVFKYGAAASYYKMDTQVIAMGKQSFPAGLDADEEFPDISRCTPEVSSFLVMVSDGILVDGDDWLVALLRHFSSDDPQALANRILSESAQHGGTADDCAVMTAFLEKGSQNMTGAV